MLEKLSKRLVPYGQAHPRLRWPILGLLMLAWGLDSAWAFIRTLGRKIWAVVQEAGQHLRETGLTSQGIHDNAERLLDAGIRAAKKLPGLWNHVRQDVLPLAMARGRVAWNAARQWCLTRMGVVKETAPMYLARAKAFSKGAGRGVAGFARRTADKLRADLPQYRRHAPRRVMAAALALVLCLGMLPVPAFAAEWRSTCPHDLGQHDETCGYAAAVEAQPCSHTEHADCGYVEAIPETPCTCGAEVGEDGNIVHAEGCTYAPATEGTPCPHQQGSHDTACGYAEAVAETPCAHEHDETCGGLATAVEPPQEPEIPAIPECTCGAVPDADGVTTHAADCPLYTAPEQPQPPVLMEITSLEGAPEAALTAMEGAWDARSLPETLTGVYEGGTVELSVRWDGLPTRLAKGDYPLTAHLTLLEGYALAEGVNAPTVALTLTPDPAVEAVRALMADLPTLEDIQTMPEEERMASGGAYEKVEAAYNAYDALTDTQKALLPGAMDTFTALQAALGAPMLMSDWDVLPEHTKTVYIDTAADLKALSDVVIDLNSKYIAPGVDYQAEQVTMNGQSYTFVIGDAGFDYSNRSICRGTQFYLRNDIDLSGYDYWVPIGIGSDGAVFDGNFDGSFDGKRYTISGMKTGKDTRGYYGLFGYVGINGTIEDLTIKDSTVSGCGYLGGIAGSVYRGSISNCVSYADITCTAGTSSLIGGIAGQVNQGGIWGCTNYGAISVEQSAGGYAGGIAGSAFAYSQETIGRCVNYGSVSSVGSAAVGGIAGTIEAPIKSCANFGTVSTNYAEAGGIVGFNNCSVASGNPLGWFSIKDCYNAGSVKTSGHAGGIAGESRGSGDNGFSEMGVKILNCYNAGSVQTTGETKYAGGIIGFVREATDGRHITVSNCISLGPLVKGMSPDAAQRIIGKGNTGDVLENLYARKDMHVNGKTQTGSDVASGSGADIALGTKLTTVFDGWDTLLWSLPTDPGTLTIGGALPTLIKYMPADAVQAPTLLDIPPNTYTVTFYNGGVAYGENTPQKSQELVEGGKAVKPADPTHPTDNTKVFSGWTTDQAGNVPFDFSTPITDYLKLYAKWETASYTVSFDLNYEGAGDPPASKQVQYNSHYGELPTPTRPRYSFNGWWLESTCDTLITKFYTCTTLGNHSLYASWKLSAFSVQPQHYAAAFDGASHTIGVTVPDDIPGATLTYQWYRGTGSSATEIPGATNAAYPVRNVADTGEYTCKVERITESKPQTAQATVTCEITAKEAAVVWQTADNYTYNKRDQSSSVIATCDGADGTTVTLTVIFYNNSTFMNVGDYIAQATMKTDAENYVLTNTDIRLRIDKCPRTMPAPEVKKVWSTEISLEEPLKPSAGEGKVECAISTTNVAPSSGWKEGTGYGYSFEGLKAGTTYYFFARVTGDPNYKDAVSPSTSATTETTTLSSIAVTKNPTFLSYVAYEELSRAGLVVTATYANGSKEVITDYTVVYPDNRTSFRVGDTSVTLTYDGKSCELSGFKVVMYPVTVPTIENLDYNGEVQTAVVAESEYYTVTKNDGGTDVGNYTVEITLKDPQNFKWEDETVGAKKTLGYRIRSVSNKWLETPSCADIIFGETPVVNATPRFGKETMTVKFATRADSSASRYDAPNNAGTWYAVLYVPKTDNYSYLNEYIEFKVAVRPYDETSFTIEPIPDQTFTDSEITPPLVIKWGETTIDSWHYTVEYLNNLKVGTATAKIKFKGGYSGSAAVNFQIVAPPLPEDTTNDDIFNISGKDLMKWHNEDITLEISWGPWYIGTSNGSWLDSVTLSTESTKVNGEIVPSSKDLLIRKAVAYNDYRYYQTPVTYLLDKTMPEIVVDGMGEDGVNKIWGDEKVITIHITDELSGMRYVEIMGSDASTKEIYGPDANLGQTPIPADGVYTYPVQANDVYTITAYDIADNQPLWKGELPTFVVEKIDREKPTATFGEITGTQGADGWFTGTVTVNVNVDDPETIPDDDTSLAVNESNKSGIANWEYSLDGGTSWTAMGADATSFTIDTDGDYTDKLRLRATDNAGNVSETAATGVKLDKVRLGAPTVVATVDGGAYDGNFTAKTVNIAATASETPVSGATLQYKVDEGEWQAYTAPIAHSTNTPTEGVTYAFRTLSGAGAVSETATVIVKRQTMDNAMLDSADNKYADSDMTIDSEGIKDGWYTKDVTVTVTKKENITDGETSYPADTFYQMDGQEPAVKLDGNTINITGDSIHTLEIWTQDVAGNETTHLEITIKIDKTAPTITDVAGNPTNWTKDDANITFTAADATSGVKSVVVTHADGESVTYTDGGFTADRNGEYTITVTDEAGHTTIETVTVDKIDKSTLTKPTVTGYTSDTWVKEPITFTITTTDTSSSGIKFQVKVGDADWAEVTSPYAVSDNTDGVAYSFRTISGAGATSETVDFTVKLDQTTPVVSLAATAGGAAYTGAATAHDVVITPSNTASNISGQTWYYQKTGDADWTALEGDSLTVNFNCDTTFTFKAVSGAGVESATQSVAVKRSALSDEDLAETEYGESDFTVTPAADENGWHTEIPTVTVKAKDTVGTDGLEATTYYELYKSPDISGAKTKLADPFTIAPTEDGVWTLKIWTEDEAGNKTNAYEIILKVDTTDPTITDVAGKPAAWQNTDATITFKAADATSGVKSVVVTHADGQSVTYTDGGFTADRNGEYTITVTDEAGHTTTEAVTVAYIEKAAPVISDVALSGTQGTDGWYTADVTVTVTATDEGGSTLATDAYSFDGGATWQSGNSKTYSDNAAHTVTVWVRDTAGNLAKRDAMEVKLDKEIPTAPTVTATVGGETYASGTFTGKDVVFTLSGSATASGHGRYQYSTNGGTDWNDLTGSTYTHNTNTDDVGVTYRFRAVNGAGTASTASGDTTVKRRALSESVLTDPDNVYDPDELIPSTPTPAPDPGDTDFPYAPYWWTELPTITVPEIPYIKDPTGPVIPGTDPAIHGYEATTYYKLWREGTDAEPGKTELTDPFAIKPTADGIWTLELWTEDSVGSETTHLIRKIQVDTTAPTVTDVNGNATAWQKTDVTLTVNGAADATSGLHDLAYSFDGGASWQAASAKTFAANAGVTVWVRDKAGNTYKHAPIAIDKIDKTAPVVAWDTATAAINPNKWYGKTALTATATDDSGESLTVTLTSGGKTYENGSTIDKNGSYTFYATATDGAGNVGRSTALTVRIEILIDEFVAMVDGLNSDSGYQDILDAVNWYNGQSTTIKDRFSKSDAATAAYEKLMGLLRDKAQEAADGVTDAIKNADTVDEIEQAAKDYESLPGEAKDKVPGDVKKELEQKKKDADEAQKVIDQLENADRDKTDKDPGGSIDEKQSAQDAYKDLTDDQKALVNKDSDAVEDKGHIDTDLVKINEVLDLLKDIKKPYTPATKDQIEAAGDAYDALTDKQKDAFPKSDKAKLDALEEMRQHAQAVEDKIKALGDNPAQGDLNSAKGAYEALTADEKDMVDGALKSELDQKYKDMLDKLDADEKAAAEFAAKVEEVKNAPTVDKIKDLIKDHDALSDAAKEKLTDQTKEDYQKLVDDLTAAQPVIDKLDDIDVDHLTPGDMDKVKDALDAYDNLTGDQKKLVDEATDGKAGILDDAVKGVEDATDKIEDIPNHSGGSANPGGGPNLGDCDNTDNSNADNTGNGGHTYEEHRKAIEEAKIAYEKLTDAGRKLISDTAKERLNREYAALMAYLEYINTAKTASTNVEVAGLAEKVELPAESDSAPKTVVSVVMADSKPSHMLPIPAGKTEALSVDIKLVAKIYDNPDATAADTPIATELVQPKAGKAVLVKLKVPSGYQNDTLELWHVKDNGGRSRIEDFWLVTEGDGTYAVFEVGSFSHFVFFAEKTPTGGGGTGGGTVTPTPKPDVPSTDNGSTSVNPQQPKPGDTVTITPKPDEGYVVDKIIVTDQNGKDVPVKDNGDGSYSYTQPKGKVTVTVTFKPAPKDAQLPFTDVNEGDWFYESVKYVYEKGLMNGTASDKFSPYLDTSRGMIVTILWRLEDEPEAATVSPFPDVTADSYCAKAVAWGAENGIVKGYGNGSFGPDDPITREQLAAILYRYAGFKGMDAPATGDLSPFHGQPAPWAAEAMRWAVGAGIISGKGGSVLDPTGKATRAETAVMLHRYLENESK